MFNSPQSSANFPLVSVVIPAYNAEIFIEKTLNAVLQQSFQDLEVLVIDDGSTDRTANLVRQFSNSDHRVHLIQQNNSGVAAARNLGIKLAKGNFIAPLDADDIWFPQYLEKQVQVLLNSGPHVGLVYAWSLDIDDQDKVTGGFRAAKLEGNVYKTLICHNFLGNASASLIRKECLDVVGGYDACFKDQQAQGCEDWDLYLRIAERYEFRAVSEFLVGYRRTIDTMSSNFSGMARSQELMLQRVQQQRPEISPFLYRLSRSSFFTYLAYQSDQFGNHQAALFWSLESIKAEPLIALGRCGLYLLLIKSGVGIVISNLGRSLYPRHTTPQKPKILKNQQLRPKVRSISIQFKVLVANLLHQSLLRIE